MKKQNKKKTINYEPKKRLLNFKNITREDTENFRKLFRLVQIKLMFLGKVQRKLGKAMNSKSLLSTVKHNGRSVMQFRVLWPQLG